MSKIKSKEEFKERDEIEEYFGEIKNKSFPSWIFLILILFLVSGTISYYYFIIDNPKNILLTALNNSFNNTSTSNDYQKINYEFNLDTNIITSNKEYLDTSNIIKELALSAKGNIDFTNKENITKLNTFYKGEKLLDIDLYSKDNNTYIKSTELYDKVIKLNNEEENQNNKDYNIEIDNFETLIHSLKDEIKIILNKASYQKEYTNLDNTIVKKVTLLIDKKFKQEFYNNLLDNNDFLESYSKLSGTSKSDIKKEIKNNIDNLSDDTESIILYLSILKNDFLMFETISKEERTIITKEEIGYNYKIYNNSIIEFQGYIEVVKTDNDYEILFSLDNIEEEVNIIINLDLSLTNNQDIEVMDITNAINYEDLTENDENEMLNNIQKNKNLLSLFEDISSLYTTDIPNNEKQLTTTA